MKVLVFGAGVIGCYLAHVLSGAGNDVTLLARGEWRCGLEQNGLIIRHSLQRKTTVDPLCIAGQPGAERYDAVFAVMQHQQMWGIVDELAAIDAPLLVLVGNNMSASEMEQAIHARSESPKTVLFGFQGTGGRREDGKVICVRFGDGSMSVGGLHHMPSDAVRAELEAMFSGTKYRLTWVPDMDGWYKSHLTLILPVAYLCYATGCDLRRSTRAQRRQALDAAAEGYALLADLGIPILPEGEDQYYRPGLKRAMMAAMVFGMAKTVVGDLAASDHCRHAVTEMEGLDRAWAELRSRRPDVAMPNWDALRGAMPDWAALHRQYEGREAQ